MSIIDFQLAKKRLKILILGAYKPSGALERLEKLQNCLIKRGFEMTKLAKDFPNRQKHSQDLDEHFTIKCRKLMRNWADVSIFVFFKEAENQGVTIEMAYACLKLDDKQSRCAVFFEHKLRDFSSQVTGTIKVTKRISYEVFKSDKELCNLASGHSLKILDRLFYYLG